jgi:NAD+ synthase (glutamine-hydrolysing)
MKIALAQFNPTVGDMPGNAAGMARFIAQARDSGADLIVFPELALCGYPPKDLLLQEGFVDSCVKHARTLGEQHSTGLTVVFGVPLPVERTGPGGEGPGGKGPGGEGRGLANALVAYRDGKMVAYYDKRLLPTYDVFDEDRYFVPGNRPVVIEVPSRGGRSVRVGLSICEDLWGGKDVGFGHRYVDSPDPVAELVRPPDGSPGAEVIVNPSASPFVLGKGARHRSLLAAHAVRHSVFVAAVNQVGGNDELVFDGHAAVYSPRGELVAAGPGFEEALVLADINPGTLPREVADPMVAAGDDELAFRALVLGVRDYCRKTGFTSALLGLSGGIDSALTAVIAAAALGPARVLGVSLPSAYSSEGSKRDAAELAARLGVRMETVAIERSFRTILGELAPIFAGRNEDVTEENLQSRVRGTMLMALSNKLGAILLTTGNKSELAVGYCTLYGDMNGGLAVLSDASKQLVYRLSSWCNANWRRLGVEGLTGPPIPEASITKPPSAELRPNQTDQDSLPPYDVLDEILARTVEKRQSPARIVRETGFDAAVVARVARLIDISEYKRRQAATGIKLTGVAFGDGRRFPIAQRFKAE